MEGRSTTNRNKSEKNLVADQPGRFIFMSGVLIAGIFGFSIRGLIHPDRISKYIQQASQQIHRDVVVKFDESYLDLSNRGWPQLEIVVKQVLMESKQECWMQPLVYIDELSLPLSIYNFFTTGHLISQIKANKVDLRFRSEFSECGSLDHKLAPSAAGMVVTKAVSLVNTKKEPEKQIKSSLEIVQINHLSLFHEKYPQFFLEFDNIAFLIKSELPKVIELKARTHLFKETKLVDYASSGQLNVEYKEFPEENIAVNFFGNLREGQYSLNLNYKPKDKILQLESDLRHIPLSQVLSLLKQFDLLKKDLNGKQIWISLKAQSVAKVADWRKIPLSVRQLKVEGDLGELQSEKIELLSLDPLLYRPFVLSLQPIDLDRFLGLINQKQKLDFLGHMGKSYGQIYYKDEMNLQWAGEFRGLEFIFSSKGQREVQTINRILADINLKSGNWDFNVKEIEPQEGSFKGQLRLTANYDFQNMHFSMSTNELMLSPAIQKHITNGGYLSSFKTQMQGDWKNGFLNGFRGQVKVVDVKVDGFQANNLNLNFNTVGNETLIRAQAQTVQVEDKSAGFPLLRLIQIDNSDDQKYLLRNVSGNFIRHKNNTQFKWRQLSWQQDNPSLRVRTEGEWNSESQLSGTISVNSSRGSKKWNIRGQRDKPEIVSSASGI